MSARDLADERPLEPGDEAALGCEKFGEQVVLLHYGELTGDAAVAVTEHVSGCVPCERAVKAVARLAGELDGIHVPPPDPEGWERVRRVVVDHADSRSTVTAGRFTSGWLRVAASTLLAFGVGAVVGSLAIQEPSYAASVREVKVEADRLYVELLDFPSALTHYQLVVSAGSGLAELDTEVDDARSKRGPLTSYLQGVRESDLRERRAVLEQCIAERPGAPFVHRAVAVYAGSLERRPVQGIGSQAPSPVSPVDPRAFRLQLDAEFLSNLRILQRAPRPPDGAYWRHVQVALKRCEPLVHHPVVRAATRLQLGITHERLDQADQAAEVYRDLLTTASPGSGVARVLVVAEARLGKLPSSR